MRHKLFVALLAVVAGITLTAAVLIQPDDKSPFLEDRGELLIRKIGDDLLLQAGDSISRVLPVKRLGNDVFQLEFEDKFSFVPDSLVNIVRRSLAEGKLPLSYMVKVFECSKFNMVYGFEVRRSSQDIEPCLGRVQPTGCYSIQVAFTEPVGPTKSGQNYYFGIAAVLSIAVLAFVLWTPRRTRNDDTIPAVQKVTTVGSLKFEEDTGVLKRGGKMMLLSNKESKLLSILASNRNQLVDREQLQNEIWTSEGVITSRSLDMFISKLRKKLSDDPSIRIVNIHGRGYRLEVAD
jgi:hypothetical protein